MEYLRFWLTNDGVKPTNEKVEAITNMKPYTSQKEVCQLIGVVNYYRNLWAKHPHMLAPLTRIEYNKVKFKWTKIEQDAFDGIQRIMATILY